jgi:hypothetical protein
MIPLKKKILFVFFLRKLDRRIRNQRFFEELEVFDSLFAENDFQVYLERKRSTGNSIN